MLPFSLSYHLENIKEKLILSQLNYRISLGNINENIYLNVGWLKYIFAIFAYTYLGIRILLDIIVFFFINIVKFSKNILFSPLGLLKKTNTKRAISGTEKKKSFILATVIASPFILVFIYFIGFFLLLSGEVDKENQDFLLKLHKYRTAVSVRDKHNHLLGIMPNTIRPPNDYIDISYDNNKKEPQYIKSHNRESSLYVNEVPDFFWKVLTEREHKGLTFVDEEGFLGYLKGVWKRSYKGVDVISLGLNLVKRMLKKISIDIDAGSGGGGSTPMNSMVKNLYGNNYFEITKKHKRLDGKIYYANHNIEEHLKYECPLLINLDRIACRKWVEYKAARDLFPYLSKNNGKEFKRWVAMHAAFVGSVGGNGVYGLQAAAAIMFGKKPNELNMAEQSFLAASYLTDFRFSKLSTIKKHTEAKWKSVCEKNAQYLTRTERWECRKRVAKKIAEKVLTNQFSSTKLANKKVDLEVQFKAMSRPKMPEIPSILKPFFDQEKINGNKGSENELKKKLKNKKIKDYANLTARLNKFMPSFKLLVKNELRNFSKMYPTYNPVEVVVTLPLAEDLKFRRGIESVLKVTDKNHPFNKHLSRNFDKNDRASIRISVASLKTGNLVRYYLQEGTSAVEEKLKLPATRPIASIAKIPLAALLVSKGLKEKSSLCNRYYRGLKNAGGDVGVKDCSQRFSFEESIGRSKNLPLRYILNKMVDEQSIGQLFIDFGLKSDKKQKNVSNKSHYIENLSFGRAVASASHTHNIINIISNLLIYKNTSPPSSIHSIETINYVRYDEALQASEHSYIRARKTSKLSNVSKYLQGSERIKTMNTLLSAPVKKTYGTLYFLNNIKFGKVVHGKSGTFDTENHSIKDKYAVGTLKVKDEHYSFSILVGSEDYKDKGLIKNIKSQKLIKPLVQKIVDSLYFEDAN